jgi:hypothetical protein
MCNPDKQHKVPLNLVMQPSEKNAKWTRQRFFARTLPIFLITHNNFVPYTSEVVTPFQDKLLCMINIEF